MKTVLWQSLNDNERKTLLLREVSNQADILRVTVESIIARVKRDGDQALFEYTQTFDKVALDQLKVTPEEFKAAEHVDVTIKSAIQEAVLRIRTYHEKQKPKAYEINYEGITCRREYRAIDAVGLYIPGGRAPLVSTVLMLAIPALIAGPERLVMVTPPQQDGRINAAILYAAQLLGLGEIYKVGGAQAIAALAYGTQTIPKVDKICGPGNAYVTLAKQCVAEDPMGAALDLPAGPSEVLVIADKNADPAWVAADLMAQAEHDVLAGIVLVSDDPALIPKVWAAIETQINSLSHQATIRASLENAQFIVTEDLKQAMLVSNQYAPEHLILQVDEAEQYLPLVKNAGSIFVGKWTPEALGDYGSGPTHVLPTYGYAKAYSGLCVESFMKSISIQHASREGFIKIAPMVNTLASCEGLDAHRNAVEVRLQSMKETLNEVA